MTTESANSTGRTYRKRARAEQEERTRERIAAATVRLHQTVGPARTTVKGVAEEAGVQRATVYRHFPTEEALFDACTAHYYAQHPMPDITAWADVSDPGERLRRGLTEMYAFYTDTEPMFESTGRDIGRIPAMAKATGQFMGFLEAAGDILVSGRRERGGARRRARAAIGHALLFPTWRSLIRMQELSNAEAVALMTGLVDSAGRSRPR
jgi:AcrR family transcriptional regulator